jgi:hypothetical protein
MEIRIRSTGQVMYESEFRQYLKDTNGPSYETLTPEIMAELGVDPVFEGPQATPTNVYEFSQRQGVELKADGKWYTKYVLGPLFYPYTNSEGVAVTVEEQRSAWMAMKDAEQAKNIRASRDQLLKDTDWIVTKSVETNTLVPVAWSTYRQALRDITRQDGFPWNVQWPVQPE